MGMRIRSIDAPTGAGAVGDEMPMTGQAEIRMCGWMGKTRTEEGRKRVEGGYHGSKA